MRIMARRCESHFLVFLHEKISYGACNLLVNLEVRISEWAGGAMLMIMRRRRKGLDSGGRKGELRRACVYSCHTSIRRPSCSMTSHPLFFAFQTHGGLQTRDQSFDHAMNKALRVSNRCVGSSNCTGSKWSLTRRKRRSKEPAFVSHVGQELRSSLLLRGTYRSSIKSRNFGSP